jgi:hypothetical protein
MGVVLNLAENSDLLNARSENLKELLLGERTVDTNVDDTNRDVLLCERFCDLSAQASLDGTEDDHDASGRGVAVVFEALVFGAELRIESR